VMLKGLHLPAPPPVADEADERALEPLSATTP